MSSPVATDPKDAAAAAEKEKEALERHRRAVLREIVVTERSYCQDLSILIDVRASIVRGRELTYTTRSSLARSSP